MPTAAELLAALPADDSSPPGSESEQLEQLFRNLAHRPVPTGGLHRLFSLGGLSAKLSMAYFAYWIRSWYKPHEASQRDLLETNLRNAIDTLETMSYLRGAVAKLGQFMACLPDVMPDGYVETLNSLHFQAPPMHYALIREQLLSEIGDPHEIFAEFDETAIAAASVGQVHRARLKTGEPVAVKIQYPGIARTIRADLRNLRTTMRPFLLNYDWKAIDALFDEIRTGLERETDYEHEATNLRDCRRYFVDDEYIVVPDVYDQFSTRRVLTMDYLAGQSLEEYLSTNPDQAGRDHYGLQICRALFRLFTAKMLYSDSHPGNFIFMDNGQLGFIDFGNVRRFNEEEWQIHLKVNEARNSNDPQDHIDICQRSAMMTDEEAKKHKQMLDIIVECFAIYNEPLLFDGAFDYGNPDYMRRMVDCMARASKQKWVRQMPMNAFSHRLNFQLVALLYQLKCRVNVRCKSLNESELWDD